MQEGTWRHDLLESVQRLSDCDLVAQLKGLAARERRATALLVAHLAELDTRDVHLREGYSSLFSYCCHVLALSGHEAYNRIEAARTARRFPVVLELLEAGAVNLTTIRLLGPHLTMANHRGLLESARGKTKAEVQEIVARLSPRADVPASVRKLPAARAESAGGGKMDVPPALALWRAPAAPVVGFTSSEASAASCTLSRLEAREPRASNTGPVCGTASPVPACAGSAASVPRAVAAVSPSRAGTFAISPSSSFARRPAEITPLSADRYKYQLTIGGSTLEKLRLAKDMLRHALPSGDDEAVLDRALTALLTHLARKKFGVEQKDGSSAPTGPQRGRGEARHGNAETGCAQLEVRPHLVGTPVTSKLRCDWGDWGDSRHIPTSVKRVVWVRDLGRCAFVGVHGRRCGERAFLEFHHVRPFAVGGEPTVGQHPAAVQAPQPLRGARAGDGPRGRALGGTYRSARDVDPVDPIGHSFRNESAISGRPSGADSVAEARTIG